MNSSSQTPSISLAPCKKPGGEGKIWREKAGFVTDFLAFFSLEGARLTCHGTRRRPDSTLSTGDWPGVSGETISAGSFYAEKLRPPRVLITGYGTLDYLHLDWC